MPTPGRSLTTVVHTCLEVVTGHQCQPLASWGPLTVGSGLGHVQSLGQRVSGVLACLRVEGASLRPIIWRKCPISGWRDWPMSYQSARGDPRSPLWALCLHRDQTGREKESHGQTLRLVTLSPLLSQVSAWYSLSCCWRLSCRDAGLLSHMASSSRKVRNADFFLKKLDIMENLNLDV